MLLGPLGYTVAAAAAVAAAVSEGGYISSDEASEETNEAGNVSPRVWGLGDAIRIILEMRSLGFSFRV